MFGRELDGKQVIARNILAKGSGELGEKEEPPKHNFDHHCLGKLG